MKWIKISDKSPDLFNFVLVLFNDKSQALIGVALRNKEEEWEFYNKYPLVTDYIKWLKVEYKMKSENITHWMPLPQPPEE